MGPPRRDELSPPAARAGDTDGGLRVGYVHSIMHKRACGALTRSVRPMPGRRPEGSRRDGVRFQPLCTRQQADDVEEMSNVDRQFGKTDGVRRCQLSCVDSSGRIWFRCDKKLTNSFEKIVK